MPVNLQSSDGATPSVPNQTKGSSLMRSKSLRLSSSKQKLEAPTSTLTRHGSIRLPKAPTVTATKPNFGSLRKPPLKPKPSFCSSKSIENLESGSKNNAEIKRPSTVFSAVKSEKVAAADLHRTPSGSPTSLYSDKSQSQEASSWCATDLGIHLKRVTEEHEKLQSEYARLRMQMLESPSFYPPSNLRREQQHLSQSDSHLASIPENCGDVVSSESTDKMHRQAQEEIVQNYRNEVVKLNEENRRLQKKYWEQVLNSELPDDESCKSASQQIVSLIEKLDQKEKELCDATGKIQELENHLATTNLELQQSLDALQDHQKCLEETTHHRDELTKQVREYRSALRDARDDLEFLQVERSTLAETFQDIEMSNRVTQAELMKEQNRSSELMDRARKLYAKVKDKNYQIQLLQGELDRTAGNCQDMLLSQGAEKTMISMHLSQISMGVHNLLTLASDFAANELSMQKEMLEEVMTDLDSEGERSESPPKENGSIIPNGFTSPISLPSESPSINQPSDIHHSLPDISSFEPSSSLYSSTSSESERPVSLVQSMVRAFEKSTKPTRPSMKPSPDNNSDSIQSSIENLSSNINCDLSVHSSPSKESSPMTSSAFKPIGMATAFRPLQQKSLELDILPSEKVMTEEDKKASLMTQLDQLNALVKKVAKIVELMQNGFLSKIKTMLEEKNNLQEEFRIFRNKQYEVQTELNIKNNLFKEANTRVEDLLEELKKVKEDGVVEKEELLQKNSSLVEKMRGLEAINTEQSNQMNNEIKEMMGVTPLSDFTSNAQTICDKLALKREIAQLKASLTHKETALQQIAQKFSRTTTALQESLKKSHEEIKVLDDVIEKAFAILDTNSELVNQHEVLQNLKSLVSGNNSSNVDIKFNCSNTEIII